MLDLNDIALFVHVVRSGSFAGAARRLGVPANTVSRRVQELEKNLGTRLLQRSTRSLTLTSAGEEFNSRCAGAVAGLIEAGQDLSSESQEPSGLVRVAAPADFLDLFVMEWIAEFLATYPKVRLALVLSDSKADLIEDRIDVAFRGGLLEDSEYIGRQVLSAGNDGLVASPGYLAARGAPSTLQDLQEHDCVTFVQSGIGHVTWRMAKPDGIEEAVQVAPRFAGNTAQALRKATLAGLGVTLLPRAILMKDLQAGRLVPVMPEYQRPGHGLNVLYPSRRHLAPAVSAFIDLVVAKVGELDATLTPLRP
ncbi:LysR family transcriptional regulator [Variovorax sp. efr-133-TYG-130]|uniref:LysR family transcriptional regulator n=1 Tax=Variovorax sp. efr-133-TYG-130 TaxID=3040327 RepID=UPI002555E160|nr:LysR family transcriptional regulator [Variovorax sp. efr-133-TYG-130]